MKYIKLKIVRMKSGQRKKQKKNKHTYFLDRHQREKERKIMSDKLPLDN